jgi:diaminohydroxyphosphoribosylaminopyrimidine deaminase / 5-amino-6-(5-phosphoribosylamino)uracil reductase
MPPAHKENKNIYYPDPKNIVSLQVSHETFMNRCLQLAAMGEGNTAPNPLVGCVIVYKNRIIGEGYHHQYGEGHAEVNAINSVKQKELLSKSQLYVNLEPCAHHGKTPPCTDLILYHKIPEVIIGCKDPFKEVAGKGIAILIKNGVKVVENVLFNECRNLNRRFFTYHERKRPYIVLKWAQSRDGFIGQMNKQIKISGKTTDKLIHLLRSREAAIMVGTNTALTDDPALTVRNWSGNNPVRIVIDNHLRLPKTLQLFDHLSPTLVYNTKLNATEENLTFVKISSGENNLPEILQHLYYTQLISLMVEGGAGLLNSFIQLNLWDEAIMIVGDLQLNEGIPAPRMVAESNEKINSGKDQILFFKNNNPSS